MRTDIWSVGVILYRILPGNSPFPQKEQTSLVGAIVMNEPNLLPDYAHKGLGEVIKLALTKDCKIRFGSTNSMKAKVRKCLGKIRLAELQRRNLALTLKAHQLAHEVIKKKRERKNLVIIQNRI